MLANIYRDMSFSWGPMTYRVAHEMSYHFIILIHINPCDFFMGILERESVRKEARKCSAAQGPHSEVVPRAVSEDLCRKVVTNARVRLQEVVRHIEHVLLQEQFSSLWGLILYQMSNAFVIIKMCYVYNQWYDIWCATLPVVRHFTNWCAGFQLWSILTVYDVYRIFHVLQHSFARLQHR
jgi:hypothetical protein